MRSKTNEQLETSDLLLCLSNKSSNEHLSIENYLNLVNKQATVDLNSLSFDVQILSKPKKKLFKIY